MTLTKERLAEIKARAEAATDKALSDCPGWRRVQECPGYCVDESGNVISVYWRFRGIEKKQITPTKDKYGYLKIRLQFPSGERRKFMMHRIVCRAFHGEPHEHQTQTRHLNGVKTDNRPENVRWGTPGENGKDKIRLGESATGEANGASALADWEVMILKQLVEYDIPMARIAEWMNVNPSTVSNIANGKYRVSIGSARTDVPALLAEVERLRWLIAKAVPCHHCCPHCPWCYGQFDYDDTTKIEHENCPAFTPEGEFK